MIFDVVDVRFAQADVKAHLAGGYLLLFPQCSEAAGQLLFKHNIHPPKKLFYNCTRCLLKIMVLYTIFKMEYKFELAIN